MRDHQQEIKEREKWQPLCSNIDLEKKENAQNLNLHVLISIKGVWA